MPIDNTELDVWVPELWSDDVLKIFYDEAVLANRVQRKDADVKAYGDIVHLTSMASISVNDVTAATGAVTDQDTTPTEQQLTVNKWKEATIQIVDKADIQSKISMVEQFKLAYADALKEQIDADLAALSTDVTTNIVGDGSGAFNEDLAVGAIGKLLNTKQASALRDPNRVSFVLDTKEWPSMKQVKSWSEAHITGESMGGALKMSVPNIYGVPTFFTTQIQAVSGVNQNLLFLREAFALAIQKQIEFRELVSSGLARRYNGNVLYGVKTRAEGRACRIDTKS